MLERLRYVRQTFFDLVRAREIASVFLKYGYDDLARLLHLPRLLGLPTRRLRERAAAIRSLTKPQRLRLALEELGPTFVKAGQIVSSRSGLVPPDYVAELSRLQDAVTPMPFDSVEQVLNAELRRPWSEVFVSVDREPLGAASIGQVHRALLHTGEEVVVKVQRPGILDKVQTDLDILARFVGLLEHQVEEMRVWRPVALVEQLRRDLLRELDYQVEAGNMRRFAEQFRGRAGLKVPAAYAEYSTSRLLVMDLISGQKLAEFAAAEPAGPRRAGVAESIADLVMQQIFVHGFFHADPHPGNLMILPGPTVCFLDFGMMGFLPREGREGFASLVGAIAERDEEAATRALLELSEPGLGEARHGLSADMADFIHRNFNLAMKEFSFARVTRELLGLTARYHLVIPPDLVSMLKAFGQMEVVVRTLDPQRDLMAQARPFLRAVRLERVGPRRLVRTLADSGEDFVTLLRTLPRDLRSLLGKLRAGEGRLILRHDGLEPVRRSLDQVTNRVAFAIVLAALIVGNALIIHARMPPLWHGVPLVGLLGFLVTGFLGLWLLVSILRHGRM
ncbi:MAG: AarF/ABC1/UbiB kinase family protein [Verrucomicrobia bacterium]|nr:AarF/ABC1/UbiB kinase family protein [Verrucomicrobiota bacterium]